MSLLAELHLVVEERKSPGPWLRRALLTLESQADRAGVRTWMVERAAYGTLLLGAVAAQHGPTLGTAPLAETLVQVAGLSVSVVALLVGAELDSISTREREQAEAEGREPVRVACSARAEQLRTLLPWLGLAGLALAFGAVGAVAMGWRTLYPAWRRWYRAHRPLGRKSLTDVTWQAQPTALTCGQTCVAMLTGRSVGEVCEEMGRWGQTGDTGIWLVLQAQGLEMDYGGSRGLPRPGTPSTLFLRYEDGRGRWAVWTGERVFDPGCGEFASLLAAQERWAASSMTLESHHAVRPRLGPAPENLHESLARYRRDGETCPPGPGDRLRIALTALRDAELVHLMANVGGRYPSDEHSAVQAEAGRRGRERIRAAVHAVALTESAQEGM